MLTGDSLSTASHASLASLLPRPLVLASHSASIGGQMHGDDFDERKKGFARYSIVKAALPVLWQPAH